MAVKQVGSSPANPLDAATKKYAEDTFLQNPGILLANASSVGAKGDAVVLTTGAVTSGSTALTASGAAFTSADVGKKILVYSGTDTTAPLRTTIAAYVSVTAVTLAAAPTFTGTGLRTVYGTDDTTAIQSGYTAARAAGLAFRLSSGRAYLVGPLNLDGDNGILTGYGATLLSTVWQSDDQICVRQSGNNVQSVGYKIDMAIPYRTMQAGYGTYDTLRIGGTAAEGWSTGVRVIDLKTDGGSGMNVFRASNVIVEGCSITNSHGNSIGSVNCKTNVQIVKNYCVNGNDDLIAVTADAGTGQPTYNVVVANNVMEYGDAGGIKIVGADRLAITGNVIRSTYTAAIKVGEASFGLQSSYRPVITGNKIYGGGQCYGTVNGIARYHATMSTNAYGIQLDRNNDGTPVADATIVGNLVVASADRAIQADAANGLTIASNRVITAGGYGISIGDPGDSSYSRATDVTITGNLVRGVRGGINIGSIVGFRASDNTVRSYSSGGGSGYRGIQYGYLKNYRISDNDIVNDDGGGDQIFDYTTAVGVPNANTNGQVWGNSPAAAPNVPGQLSNTFWVGGYSLFFFTGNPALGWYTAGSRGFNAGSTAGATADLTCSTTGFACFTPWAASTAVTAGTIVYSGSNVYICTTAGTTSSTPVSGTGTSISDGTVTWSYVSARALFAAPAGATVAGVILQRTKTGEYIGPINTQSKGTTLMLSGFLYAVPITLSAASTAATLNFKVTTAGSSNCVGVIGIWADDGTMSPTGTPKASATLGSADLASTGTKSKTISASLPAGTYWLYMLITAGTTMPTVVSIAGQTFGLPAHSDPANNVPALATSSQSAAPTTPPGLSVFTSGAPFMTLGI